MCLFKLFRKKKEVDELAEYENNNYSYNEPVDNHYPPNVEDAIFVTCGDIFTIDGQIVVMGISLQDISVGDTIMIGTREVVVNKIEIFRKMVKSLKPLENGALYIGKELDLKPYILGLIDSSNNSKPIAFTSKPTNKYIYFYRKK